MVGEMAASECGFHRCRRTGSRVAGPEVGKAPGSDQAARFDELCCAIDGKRFNATLANLHDYVGRS